MAGPFKRHLLIVFQPGSPVRESGFYFWLLAQSAAIAFLLFVCYNRKKHGFAAGLLYEQNKEALYAEF